MISLKGLHTNGPCRVLLSSQGAAPEQPRVSNHLLLEGSKMPIKRGNASLFGMFRKAEAAGLPSSQLHSVTPNPHSDSCSVSSSTGEVPCAATEQCSTDSLSPTSHPRDRYSATSTSPTHQALKAIEATQAILLQLCSPWHPPALLLSPITLKGW